MLKKTIYLSVSMDDLLGHPLDSRERLAAPPRLFVVGKIPIPLQGLRVAVVGTRNPSNQAVEFTQRLVEALVREGVVVVSGLARGVDTVAHTTAIKNRGKTIAVLGTTLNKFYPPENRELQLTIMREHLAVSQFPPNHGTLPHDFILRNHTMAIITNASVIVEAAERSGALSHGWAAIRLGRPVYVPPFILERNLEWPKRMMRHGAVVLENFDDLLSSLHRKM
ncbi:MAG: DNA-processing protein DprA [Candidatus Caldarchaeum sp.]